MTNQRILEPEYNKFAELEKRIKKIEFTLKWQWVGIMVGAYIGVYFGSR